MAKTLDSILWGISDKDVAIPDGTELTDLLLEVRLEASCFGSPEVVSAVDGFMSAMNVGHLDHFHKVDALRALYGLVRIQQRTPVFSG